jgi:hypothetical protein
LSIDHHKQAFVLLFGYSGVDINIMGICLLSKYI